jgi:hypothetical protein
MATTPLPCRVEVLQGETWVVHNARHENEALRLWLQHSGLATPSRPRPAARLYLRGALVMDTTRPPEWTTLRWS